MDSSNKKKKIIKKKKPKSFVVNNVGNENKIVYKEIPNKVLKPESWVLPNKKRFPSWINETFIKYRLTEDIQKRKGSDFKPFPYQQFIRDYMQLDSPYRGILLYHGLGSGKTCTSIVIAESMRNDKKILVLLPASLKHNFIGKVGKEGLKFCGSSDYRNKDSGNSRIKDHYTFISYNASNTLKQIEKYGSLDNHVIIVDESHKLLSMMSNSMEGMSKQGYEIYKKLMECKNSKIVFLSGTPVNTEAFEAGLMFNVLRGYIEIINFNIQKVDEGKYGRTWDLGEYEKILEKMDEVDYFEVNKMNRTVKMHIRASTFHPDFKDVVERVIDQSDKAGIVLGFDSIVNHTAFPDVKEDFEKYFVDRRDPLNEKIGNKDVFMRRILGLVSYYRGAKPIYYPTVEPVIFVRVPMSDYQFDQYVEARDVEQDSERKGKIAAMSRKASNSRPRGGLFRIFSREFSNFVFPPDIDRPYLKHASIKKPTGKKKDSNFTNSIKDADIVANDVIENDKKKLNEKYQRRLNESLKKLDDGASTYLVAGATGLGKYSPKMEAILNNIKKGPGKVLVYSNFRTLEGIEIFSKVLDHNGFRRYSPVKKNSGLTYTLFTGTEDEKERVKSLEVYNSYENRNGDLIKVLLITSAGAEGLDLKCVRQVHIMEPYWTEIRAEQVIGRAVRVNSHIDLPVKDRTVQIYRYHSVFTADQEKERKREPISTDEYIYESAMVKQRVVDEILMMMKEMSVDCVLNAYDNNAGSNSKIKCFAFGKDKSGMSFLPDLNKDIIYSQTGVSTKEVERKIILGGITKDGDVVYVHDGNLYGATNSGRIKKLKGKVKVVKKVGVDLDNGDVYDFKAVKSGGNLIKLGRIGGKGEFIKK